MTLYPNLPGPLARTLIRDLAAVVLLLLFAWLGVHVHDAVASLQSVGTGVSEAGTSVQQGFASAASALNGVPLVGGSIAQALHAAGGATGGRLVVLGEDGNAAIRHLASVLGLTTWGVPTLLLLAVVAPRRVREVRRLTALRRAVDGPDAAARRRLLAFRALVEAREEALFAVSVDPVADLLHGGGDALAAAVLRSEGIRPR